MNEYKYKLSICLVTMNRALQLKEAIESCLACDLPDKTEFVIIDNASTDGTETVIANFFQENPYDYYYEKLSNNIRVLHNEIIDLGDVMLAALEE